MKHRILSHQETMMVLEYVSRSDNCTKERDTAIVMLLMNCGLRHCEVVNIPFNEWQKSHFCYGLDQLCVLGKGNRVRWIEPNPETICSMKRYVDVRPTYEDDEPEALFLSESKRSYGTNLSIRSIQGIVKEALKATNVEATPYSLRHTFAVANYVAGMDIHDLMRILGHDSLASTQKYLDPKLVWIDEVNSYRDLYSR